MRETPLPNGRNWWGGTLADMDNCSRDPVLQARFEADGYVVVPLLSPDEAASARERAQAFIPPDPSINDPLINDPQAAPYNSQFEADHRDAAAHFVSSLVAERFEALMEGHRSVGGCVMTKVAGSGRLAQHHPQTADIYDTIVYCWVTLDDVGPESGGLRVVPRSHRIVRHIQCFETAPYFADFAEAAEDRFAITLCLRAGEAVLFEGSLLHGSAANASGGHRVRMLAQSLPADSRLCILTQRGNGVFAAFGVEGAVVDPTMFCVHGGNLEGLPALGRLNNRNERLNERESAELLRLGAKIRPGHDPIDVVRAKSARPRTFQAISRVRPLARAMIGG